MKNGYRLVSCIAVISLTSGCYQNMRARGPEISVAGKPTITYTTVARTEEQLPQCDRGTEGLKAYVATSDEFLKCINFSWYSARPGDTTGRFEARSPIRYNEWHDSKNQKRWSAPRSSEIQVDRVSPKICQAGWKIPTSEELKAASRNGLFDGIKAHGGIAFDKAWTADQGAITGIARGEFDEDKPASRPVSSAGVYCVASAQTN